MPHDLARLVDSIAPLVELVPVPAMIGTRPRAVSITVFTTSSCSASESVGVSPVVPQATRPSIPFWICISTILARAFTSTRSSLPNGVTSAVKAPCKLGIAILRSSQPIGELLPFHQRLDGFPGAHDAPSLPAHQDLRRTRAGVVRRGHRKSIGAG